MLTIAAQISYLGSGQTKHLHYYNLPLYQCKKGADNDKNPLLSYTGYRCCVYTIILVEQLPQYKSIIARLPQGLGRSCSYAKISGCLSVLDFGVICTGVHNWRKVI